MRYKKFRLSTLLLLGLGLTTLQAQEAVSATGGNATGTGGTASYTTGQVVYNTNSGTNGSVEQGVQQPFKISVVRVTVEGEGINLTFSAYPNPTTDFLILNIDGEVKKHYIVSLYDVSGKLLDSKKIEGNETRIDMNNLVSAIYFLKVTSNNKEVKTFKIMKN